MYDYTFASVYPLRSANRPSTRKKKNYKMVVLSLGTIIFSFFPSFWHTNLRCQFRNFFYVLLNAIEHQLGTAIVTTAELSPQLLERIAPCLAFGQSKIHVFCYQFRLSALVADVVSVVVVNRIAENLSAMVFCSPVCAALALVKVVCFQQDRSPMPQSLFSYLMVPINLSFISYLFVCLKYSKREGANSSATVAPHKKLYQS